MSDARRETSHVVPVRIAWQLLAWVAAVALSWWGFRGWFAEWPTDLALATLGWLLLGPVVWFLVRDRRSAPAAESASPMAVSFQDFVASTVIAAISFGLSVAAGWPQWSLPPAYHDEYSYLFQAETLLAGRFSWPSDPQHPELFDQMHVLNEGRMASRYYPGNGLWIAPWLAVGAPSLGHWIAGALSAVLVYWIARDLADRATGWIAGVVFAAAPGPALFNNLLLAHAPTQLALLLFTWSFLRARRTSHVTDWTIAGGGLAFAMLCRPATAAGYALPFGLWALVQLVRASWNDTRRMVVGLGAPLLLGIGVMLAYNQAVTGDWLKSPYQLYTDLYTPRHVFGLNNVIRGEQHLGPKVLESYDTWAENLTPEKAWLNVLNRLIATALYTVDLPLMVITALLAFVLMPWMPMGWKLLIAAIVTLHAFHWPYWYAGIFGWHYVYETGPLWCLLLAYVGRCLQLTWSAQRRDLMPIWAAGFLGLAWWGMYVDAGEAWTSRWTKSIAVVAFPRQQHASFLADLQRDVTERPALVLVDGPHDGQQLDFVTNHAGLTAPLLLGRYRARTDLEAIATAFPARHLYRYRMQAHRAERISPAHR